MSLLNNLTIGIIGTGQLARMLILEGSRMGYSFCLMDPTCSNGRGCAEDLCTKLPVNEFIAKSNIITVETENIPQELLDAFAEKIIPSAEIIKICQDRLLEKKKAQSLCIQTAPYKKIDNEQDMLNQDTPAILKTRLMGYDGKGQYLVKEKGDFTKAWNALNKQPCILEKKVDFAKELSVLVFSNGNQLQLIGPMENLHKKGMLDTSIYPSRVGQKTQEEVRGVAISLAKDMNLQGTLCVEFFYLRDGTILLNEMSPRVHNSGHWTLGGASVSQFEQHLRAITGLPLSKIHHWGKAEMKNMIGGINLESLDKERAHINIYNKEPREGRKVGHVTLIK